MAIAVAATLVAKFGMKAGGDINGYKTETLKFPSFTAVGAKTGRFLQFACLDPCGWNLVIAVSVRLYPLPIGVQLDRSRGCSRFSHVIVYGTKRNVMF